MTRIPLVDTIHRCLPQTQCQLCGYSDCLAYAQAITEGEQINLCQPGGERTLAELASLCPQVEQKAPNFQYHTVTIDEQICIGCVKCITACPVSAIVGAAKQMHTVVTSDCTGCDLCIPVCPVDCIYPVKADNPIDHYVGNALEQTYSDRLMNYQHQNDLQQARKRQRRIQPTHQQMPAIDSSKRKLGKTQYQLLRIDKAMAMCRKNGDEEQLARLDAQRQQLTQAPQSLS